MTPQPLDALENLRKERPSQVAFGELSRGAERRTMQEGGRAENGSVNRAEARLTTKEGLGAYDFAIFLQERGFTDILRDVS